MGSLFKIRDIEFRGRILVASGTFGYGDECTDLVDINKLGGLITKSLTLKPREGNPPPRIVETSSGMINSIGLANIGVKRFIIEKLPLLQKYQTNIIVNIAGSSIDEYCEVLKILESQDGISAYEVNVSCPNVKEGGLNFGTNVKATAEITRRLRIITNKPLIIKLTPNVTKISDLAVAVEQEGADAVSLINTLVGMAVNIKTGKPKISTITGGLSGPAIKPIALAKVFEVVQVVKIPVIGIGGILNMEDALEFFITGAQAVQVGTGNFIYPDSAIKIQIDLDKYCLENNIHDFQSVIGSLNLSESKSLLNN